MVKGLDIFGQHFQNHTGQYILIGGGACDVQMNQKGLPFRATKDLDIILVVEALSNEFVNHFWKFIKDGEYQVAQVGDRRTFYRFIKPQAEGYPYMLELFSRNPDAINEDEDIHLTDIPTEEDASSLSAILLDTEYYEFTLANSQIIDGVSVASDIALICLKARAYLNNLKRKEEGQEIHETDIAKHKNDVIRLTATLNPADEIILPETLRTAIMAYIERVKVEKLDLKQILRQQGAGDISIDQIVAQMEKTFSLKS